MSDDSPLGSARRWLVTNSSVIVPLAALLTIGTIAWATLTWAFAEPDLAIEVQSTELRLPAQLGRQLTNAMATAPPDETPDTLEDAVAQIVRFVDQTRHFAQVTFRNNSDRSLENLDLRVRNVRTLTGWGVGGDAFTSEENAGLLERVRFDQASEQVVLGEVARLAPHATIELFLWADSPVLQFFGGAPVSATFDGGAGRYVRSVTVTGWNAFVYRDATLLVFVLLLINAAVLSVFVPKRASMADQSDSEDA